MVLTAPALVALLATPVAFSGPLGPDWIGQLRGPSLVVERAWAPAAAAVLALPAAPVGNADGNPDADRVARVADRALLTALQEAVDSLPARVTLERSGSGRYLVATAAPDVLDDLLGAMRRTVASPLPSGHLTAASDALAREATFRANSPRSRFEAVFAAHLGDPAHLGGSAHGDSASLDGGAWVVVRPGNPARARRSAGAAAAPLRLAGRAAPVEPVRAQLSADVVTSWVGSAYHFPSGATLLQAHFVRLVLEGWIKSLREPALYEFATEIDAAGRLLVRFSTQRGDAGAWEARLDRTLAAIGTGGTAGLPRGAPDARRIRELMRQARGIWSRWLADPATCARIAAEAILHGASAEEAGALVQTPGAPPSLESVAAAASGLRLSARVLYGT